MADSSRAPSLTAGPGTLITVAPAAGSISQLLRTAIDAERVGATRLHLPANQPERALALTSLREHTRMVITCGVELAGVDVISSPFVDAAIEDAVDLPAVVARVAHLVATHPGGVSVHGRGAATLPVLLAALAAGGHVLVDAPEHRLGGVSTGGPGGNDQVALVARASGLARIAGRPPLAGPAARRLLGLA